MKFKIEGSEFTIEELLHHIGKGRGNHLKSVIIEQMKAAQQRITELEATQEQSIQRSAFVEKRLIERADAAEAELARRDAAAVEPFGYFVKTLSEDGINGMEMIPSDNPLVRVATPLFAAAQPSALPPEMAAHHPLANAVHGEKAGMFISGYNQAIADAKALGCKAIKLPKRYDIEEMSRNPYESYRCIQEDEDGEYLNMKEVIESLKEQGFTVEGE